jgi:hypothetical protein
MLKNVVRIANAQGFWGDSISAAARLMEQQPNLDFITLDYLAELSLSIMAIQRDKDPTAGYAKDFLEVVDSLISHWRQGSHVRLVTNAGGLNPSACAHAVARLLAEKGCSGMRIGIVSGDDVLPQLKKYPLKGLFANLETQQPLTAVADRMVTANSYLGADGIVEALNGGADIVITGRVADPSLTVAACCSYFDWSPQQYDLIAQATVAGHLIECGTQATGGISSEWLSLDDRVNIPFPIVEMAEDGSFVIGKPPATGGRVNKAIISEQLLYEIGDPAAYLSPDVTVSMLSLQLADAGSNRIRVTGAAGFPPPPTYKVSGCYRDGWRAEAMVALFGPEAVKKGRLAGEVVLQRVANAGFSLERSLVECIGSGDLVCGIAGRRDDLLECVVRIAVADSRKEACERFAREVAPLVTSGPPALTGYTTGRPHVRPQFGYWPCLIERKNVQQQVEVINS